MSHLICPRLSKSGPKWNDLDLVFCTGEGKPLLRRHILRRHLRPVLKSAGLPATLNLYSLRHSCATLLLSAGVNPKVVSERLGHSSIVLTLDVYSQVLPSMQQTAADKLESILFRRADDTPNRKGEYLIRPKTLKL